VLRNDTEPNPHHLPLLRCRLRRRGDARRQGRRRHRRRCLPSGEFGTPLLQRSGIGRDAVAGRPAAASRDRRPARVVGYGARSRCLWSSRRHRSPWTRCGGLLRLGAVADRGLLRRQQADQRLPRHRQHRHQLAALHGLVGGRPQACLRQRHGARPLRGFRARRPRGAGRQQPRLVPSRAVPAAGGGQARAAAWW